MRLIWNAGAAIAVTGMLTSLACIGSMSGHPARAGTLPLVMTQQVADLPHRHYTGLPEHFEAANTSRDGKLTAAQAAQAGWTRIARHFDEIDADHLGFITEAQIHAYNVGHRHGHKASAADA